VPRAQRVPAARRDSFLDIGAAVSVFAEAECNKHEHHRAEDADGYEHGDRRGSCCTLAGRQLGGEGLEHVARGGKHIMREEPGAATINYRALYRLDLDQLRASHARRKLDANRHLCHADSFTQPSAPRVA